uniref:Uncharacterized protein n=1 Tax=Vespula pensylvanica TaxID=30213 RepID=A0A834U483_VESPE|nr:hypothetical protein H0235_012298 [Vespula pensylvanica]
MLRSREYRGIARNRISTPADPKHKEAFLRETDIAMDCNNLLWATIKSLDLPPDIQPSDVTDMRNHRCTPHKYPFATTNSIVEPMAVKRPTNRARELRDPRETYRTNPLVIILGFFRTGINIHSLRKGIGLVEQSSSKLDYLAFSIIEGNPRNRAAAACNTPTLHSQLRDSVAFTKFRKVRGRQNEGGKRPESCQR